MSRAIKTVIVAGGGTAGWMTAAALARGFEGLGVSIVVVESEEIGSVGVGEATIPIIHQFNQMLGINHAEFMRATHGTYKLGIEFVDWSSLGARYIHPFAEYGRDIDNLHFHQLWLKYAGMLARRGETTRLDDYNICCVAAKLGRFRHPISGERSRVAPLNYAFHFDAGAYAQFLRQYAEARGVVRHEGKIAKVDQDGENGDIAGLTLESGLKIAGDFFVD
jgi:tryptophan halogenase